LKSIKSDRSRMFAMTGMMRGSDTQQRSVLMERLGAIEDPQIREEGYLTLITQWGHFDPREAAVFLDDATDLDPKVEEMLTTVVGEVWWTNHPEEGHNWLIHNATDEHRSARMVNAVRSWVRLDANGAAKWLGQFEPSLEMDDAVSTFAISTMHL